MAVKLIRSENYEFEKMDGTIGPGEGLISRSVTDEVSETLGAGIVILKQCKFPWTLLYDETIYVIDGEVKIETDGNRFIGHQGDSFFIEKGTSIIYESTTQASFYYALYPANWKHKYR
ncbi:cupin domain-containing protein [Bacillus sp. V5-8f]|uniref:cupin domain-containing protein n=1 Tax=Bacillus sp. V5-8f TaxID=2053044 RepID=UPI0015E13A46|nr:cupin domain-containing protein [Bacillus sp. V5-8f]